MRCGWWKRWRLVGVLSMVPLVGVGCAHTISETVRRQADMTLSFTRLQADPVAYRDRTVILGGDILRIRNVQGGTLLEVLQKPLDRYEQPRLTDRTAGRFMVRCETYLDPAIYKPGRRITIAGRVLGARKGQIGEADYTYPLISCAELHLWPETPPRYEPYPWWYWDLWYWDHAWPWRPYSPPFWRPYYPYW